MKLGSGVEGLSLTCDILTITRCYTYYHIRLFRCYDRHNHLFRCYALLALFRVNLLRDHFSMSCRQAIWATSLPLTATVLLSYMCGACDISIILTVCMCNINIRVRVSIIHGPICYHPTSVLGFRILYDHTHIQQVGTPFL